MSETYKWRQIERKAHEEQAIKALKRIRVSRDDPQFTRELVEDTVMEFIAKQYPEIWYAYAGVQVKLGRLIKRKDGYYKT